MTLTSQIIQFVRDNPGKTATQIAHGIEDDPATVSGILFRLAKSSERSGIVRYENDRGAWSYKAQ